MFYRGVYFKFWQIIERWDKSVVVLNSMKAKTRSRSKKVAQPEIRSFRMPRPQKEEQKTLNRTPYHLKNLIAGVLKVRQSSFLATLATRRSSILATPMEKGWRVKIWFRLQTKMKNGHLPRWVEANSSNYVMAEGPQRVTLDAACSISLMGRLKN